MTREGALPEAVMRLTKQFAETKRVLRFGEIVSADAFSEEKVRRKPPLSKKLRRTPHASAAFQKAYRKPSYFASRLRPSAFVIV